MTFDFGAIIGSISIGYLTDRMHSKRSPVVMIAVLLSSCLSFVLTFRYLQMSIGEFYAAMFFFGFFVSGLNNILAGSCAADIGKQQGA